MRDDHAVRVIRNALRAVAAPAAAAAVSSGVQALIDAANTAAPINLGTLNSGDSTDRTFVPSEADQGPRLGGVVPAQAKLTGGCQLGGYQRLDYSSGDVSRGAQIWSGCDGAEVTVTWKPGMPKSQFRLKAAALQRHSDNRDLFKAANPVDRDGSITRKYKSDLIGRVYDQFYKVNPEFSNKLIDRIRDGMNPDHVVGAAAGRSGCRGQSAHPGRVHQPGHRQADPAADPRPAGLHSAPNQLPGTMMISSALEQAMAAVRSALPLEREWHMMNSVPDGASRTPGLEAPAEYLELICLSDGPSFGDVTVYGTKWIERNQFFADDYEGATVRLGRHLWFCFGNVGEDPLFINRQDGTVWGFPDQGIVWRDSDVFERFADSLGEFLERYALGPEYRVLSGVEEDDQWWRLLTHIGRV